MRSVPSGGLPLRIAGGLFLAALLDWRTADSALAYAVACCVNQLRNQGVRRIGNQVVFAVERP